MQRNIFDSLDESIEDIEGGEYSGPQDVVLLPLCNDPYACIRWGRWWWYIVWTPSPHFIKWVGWGRVGWGCVWWCLEMGLAILYRGFSGDQNNCFNKKWDDCHCNSFNSVDSYNSYIGERREGVVYEMGRELTPLRTVILDGLETPVCHLM